MTGSGVTRHSIFREWRITLSLIRPTGPNSRVPDAMQRATLLGKAGTHEDDEANARMMDPGSAAHHAAVAARCAASGARSHFRAASATSKLRCAIPRRRIHFSRTGCGAIRGGPLPPAIRQFTLAKIWAQESPSNMQRACFYFTCEEATFFISPSNSRDMAQRFDCQDELRWDHAFV
jgi:hypothetical protein